MLAIYDQQINSLESALNDLLLKVEQHRLELKSAKARQRKVGRVLNNLKGLIEDLTDSDAIANLRESILSLFPGSQSPVTDSSGNDSPAPVPEEIELPILKAIEDLAGGGKNLEEQAFQEQPEKPASDIPIALFTPELKTEEVVFCTQETNTTEQLEAISTSINEFCSFVAVSDNVGFIRMNKGQSAGEIMSAYLGCSSQKLAKDWAECITLWGARTEIRKPQRLINSDIKYEVKIWDISSERIEKLAKGCPSPSSPLPQSESSKKKQQILDESAEISSDGEGGMTLPTNSNLPVEETSEKPYCSSVEPQESKFYFTKARDYNALMPEFYCYLNEGNKYVGKVSEALSLDSAHQGRWRHDALRGTEWQTVSFASQEEAASDLLRRKQYSQALHDKTNAQLKQMYRFDEIEKAEAATEDALKKDAIERIDGYMQQLGWSKKQTKEFSIARFGIDHRSKMDLVQLLELAEAMKEQLNQPA